MTPSDDGSASFRNGHTKQEERNKLLLMHYLQFSELCWVCIVDNVACKGKEIPYLLPGQPTLTLKHAGFDM